MGWHGEAPFQRFGEAATSSVFGLCDFGMRLLVARERQIRFARWTFPSDDDNQMKMSLPELARSDGRHFDGQPSLSGYCGHGWTCRLPGAVAIDTRQPKVGTLKKGLHRPRLSA